MYLLDANTLIAASNQWYGLDICPAYWNWLAEACQKGLVSSITDVRKEIYKEDTEHQSALLAWCNGKGKALFQPPTYEKSDLLHIFKLVRCSGRPYTSEAIDEFTQKVDAFLIAEAWARDGIVVTLETSVPERKHSVKIPDACKDVDVPCITPFEMLRKEKVRFVLAGA